jgi:Flp pilus assembly protein TadG
MRRFSQIRREDGQAMIEFVIVLPILLTLATVVASMGLTLYQYFVITNAVQSGARKLSLEAGLPDSQACQAARQQTFDSAQGVKLAPNNDPSSVIATVGGADCDSATATDWTQGNEASVSASIPCVIHVVGVIDITCPDGGTFTASATDAIG